MIEDNEVRTKKEIEFRILFLKDMLKDSEGITRELRISCNSQISILQWVLKEF